MQHTLLHDQLTGLPNRAGLIHYLDHLLTDPTGTQQLGLCILDLDRFNDLSNALGPDTADHLLLAVASRLYALTAGTTCLAYLGADRFAFVVHPTTTVDDVIKLTEHALAVISEPFTVAGNDILVTATAGVVEGDRIGATADELLRTAGQALGWARDEGRPVVAYDPDRGAKDIVRYQIATDMNAALRNEQFTLAYQPLIDLSTGTMVGVEALARWHHPIHGEIPPHQFIADANRTGLIVELGAYLLHRACAQAAIWQRTTSAPFVVSVNVSTVQLRQPDSRTPWRRSSTAPD
jgi:diguanylate cyclase (GGDEF)-like protein